MDPSFGYTTCWYGKCNSMLTPTGIRQCDNLYKAIISLSQAITTMDRYWHMSSSHRPISKTSSQLIIFIRRASSFMSDTFPVQSVASLHLPDLKGNKIQIFELLKGDYTYVVWSSQRMESIKKHTAQTVSSCLEHELQGKTNITTCKSLDLLNIY